MEGTTVGMESGTSSNGISSVTRREVSGRCGRVDDGGDAVVMAASSGDAIGGDEDAVVTVAESIADDEEKGAVDDVKEETLPEEVRGDDEQENNAAEEKQGAVEKETVEVEADADVATEVEKVETAHEDDEDEEEKGDAAEGTLGEVGTADAAERWSRSALGTEKSTRMGTPSMSVPLRATARRVASSLSNSTKPQPLKRPVFLS